MYDLLHYNFGCKDTKNFKLFLHFFDIIICVPAFCIVVLHSHFDGAKRLLI
nr:MAG TPA: hypothetical protein [Caudoviricetes sp.]